MVYLDVRYSFKTIYSLHLEITMTATGNISGTEYQHHIYWFVGSSILWLDFGALCFLGLEYQKPNSPLRQPFFKPFKLEILGDVVYALLINLPFHTTNTLSLIRNDVPRVLTDEMCSGFWGAMTPLSISATLLSKTYIWYYTMNSFRAIGFNLVSKTHGVIWFIVLSTLFSMLWYLVALTSGEIGSTGGFYCGVRSFRGYTGGLFFVFVFANAFLQVYFMQAAYFFIKNIFASNTGSSAIHGNTMFIQNAALKNISILALQMTVSFYIIWGPITIWMVFDVLQIDFPTEMFMVASLLVKFQPLIDTFMIFKSPPFQSRKKVSPKTELVIDKKIVS